MKHRCNVPLCNTVWLTSICCGVNRDGATDQSQEFNVKLKIYNVAVITFLK